MRGVASVLGHDRTGLYGGYDAMVAYFDANIGKYGWQTYAWSNGQWHPNAQLQQYENSVQVAPATVDRDRATSSDYGYVKWASPSPAMPLGAAGSVARNANGRLEVFGLGAGDALYHIWQTTPGGTWAGWTPLGGELTSEPEAARNTDGRLEVFARGTNNALYHICQTTPGGGWGGWTSLGGALTGDPAAVQNADGRLEIFARGTNNALYHIWQTTPGGGWAGWSSLGGSLQTL